MFNDNPNPPRENLTAELDAMKSVSTALEGLSDSARKRVLSWVLDLYQYSKSMDDSPGPELASEDSEFTAESKGPENFGTLAELFAESGPATDADKSLVVAYWIQFVQGKEEVDSQQINSELKNLGYGVNNITRAIDNLTKRKPALVVQMRKSGNTKQARKKFKVTVAGKQYVSDMLGI